MENIRELVLKMKFCIGQVWQIKFHSIFKQQFIRSQILVNLAPNIYLSEIVVQYGT